MLDWRGLVGTSAANGGLALMLAGLTVPLGPTCADCGGIWLFSDPEMPRIFDMGPKVTVLPVQATVQPVVVASSSYRVHVCGLCPGQPPVDRLPTII